MSQPRILILYTGGTIGMTIDADRGVLRPFTLDRILESVPLIKRLGCAIEAVSIDQPIDSSEVQPEHWAWIAKQVADGRHLYDGFVVLHGSDTMAYTASALSFMLMGLDRPVVLTGSQLPMGLVRTDARENLITSIMVAMAKLPNGRACVPEVSILFEDKLLRGNRTKKLSSSDFEAFRSPNYPPLARAGVNIVYRHEVIETHAFNKPWAPKFEMSTQVMSIRLFPGIDLRWLPQAVMENGAKAVVLETFGSGNAPMNKSVLEPLNKLCKAGIAVVNISQCVHGSVEMEKYATGQCLAEIGVLSGADLTFEASITKLMYALANIEPRNLTTFFNTPQCGELTF